MESEQRKLRTIRTITLIISSIILFCTAIVFSEQINLKLDEMSKQNEIVDSLKIDSLKIDSLKIINQKSLIKSKILSLNTKVNSEDLPIIIDELYKIDQKNNFVTSDLMIGLIWVESRFERKAKSSMGAIGYCQIMPNIHEVPDGDEKYSPEFQINFAYNYLNTIYRLYQKQNLNNSLNRYNGRVENNNYYAKVLRVKHKISKIKV